MHDNIPPVTTLEATRILGVSVPTLRRMEARGDVHPIRTNGGLRLFDASELRKVADERLSRRRGVA